MKNYFLARFAPAMGQNEPPGLILPHYVEIHGKWFKHLFYTHTTPYSRIKVFKDV